MAVQYPALQGPDIKLVITWPGKYIEITGQDGIGGDFSSPINLANEPIDVMGNNYSDTYIGDSSHTVNVNTTYWGDKAKDINDAADNKTNADDQAFFAKEGDYGAYFSALINRGFRTGFTGQTRASVAMNCPNNGPEYDGAYEMVTIPQGAAGDTTISPPSGYAEDADNVVGIFISGSSDSTVEAVLKGSAAPESEEFSLADGHKFITTLPTGFDRITTKGPTTGPITVELIYGTRLGRAR